MAIVTLGESRWRMIRRAMLAATKANRKTFTFTESRNFARQDEENLNWLTENGFVERRATKINGQDAFALTARGVAALDLGEYEV